MKSWTRSGVSRKNSETAMAGQEMSRERAPFSTAKTRPRTRATTKPATEASKVTSRPRSRIGKIDSAKAHSPCPVSQLIPNSIASAPCPLPAADTALEEPHRRRQHQRHAEVHKEDDGVDLGRLHIFNFNLFN